MSNELSFELLHRDTSIELPLLYAIISNTVPFVLQSAIMN